MDASSPGPPRSEGELLERSRDIAGLTLGELAARLGRTVPGETLRGKGFAGQLVEAALGASAGSLPEPDFQLIGVELKTVPVGVGGRPVESTYVCTLPLDPDQALHWERSNVRRKLARVLWVPVEADPAQPLAERRVGSAVTWSPSAEEELALRADWEEFTELVVTGRVAEITAHQGVCLQVRPKAANSRARRWGVDEHGERVRTLPRGFYLRPTFTAALLARLYAGTGH
jgi:DNA mismatch repair protein MutH